MKRVPSLSELSMRQKIGQIFCLPIDEDKIDRAGHAVQHCALGTILVHPMNHDVMASCIARMNALTEHPLLVSADIEPSIDVIVGASSFPSAMGIAATGSEEISYQVGLFKAQEARAVGINWGFTPVLDVNIDPHNPIINTRSFGDNAAQVIKFAKPFLAGLRDGGVLSTAKHFPGHGNTCKDSHLGCAYSETPKELFRSLDLAPFVALIHDFSAVMSGHIVIEHLDSNMATFSKVILTDLLRKELGFTGVVVSDALVMGAVTEKYTPDQAVKQAFLAGADVLIIPDDKAFDLMDAMGKMVEKGEIPLARLDEAVERVLEAKRTLARWEEGKKPFVFQELIERHAPLSKAIVEKSLTLLNQGQCKLPVTQENTPGGIIALTIGYDKGRGASFLSVLEKKAKEYQVPFSGCQEIPAEVPSNGLVVLGVYSTVRFFSHEIRLTPEEIDKIGQIVRRFPSRVIMVMFGSPYSICDLDVDLPTCILAYDTGRVTNDAIVRGLFGEIDMKGNLPVYIPLVRRKRVSSGWGVQEILKASGSYWQTFTLHAAVQLDVFSTLHGKRFTESEIAERMKTTGRGLSMLLDALVAMGLLVKKEGQYSNSPESEMLLSSHSSHYVGHMVRHHANLVSSWEKLSEVIRKNEPVKRVPPDMERIENFLMGMFNLAMGIAPGISKKIDLSGKKSLLDLGGGPGTYAIHFCLANPEMEGTVLDLPTSEPFALRSIQKFGLEKRISFVSCDYLTQEIPGKYDVAWLSHVLHAESPQDCERMVQKAVHALNPGGTIFIHEFILNDDGTSPLFPALFALNMLVNTPGGRAYREVEIRRMLGNSGVEEIKRLDFRGPNDSSILCGRVR